MTLTQKETDLLKDMRDQELLCIEKYEKYSCSACSTELKNLFNSLADAERTHLKTINDLMGGSVKTVSGGLSADNCFCGCANYCDDTSKKCDEFLCKDMKKNTLAALLSALENEESVIELSDTVISLAKQSLSL